MGVWLQSPSALILKFKKMKFDTVSTFPHLFVMKWYDCEVIGWGIDLDYCYVQWFALEMNWDHSVIFEVTQKYCVLDFFVDYEGYSISFMGFLPTVVDIMVIWIKFTHSCSFSSLITRMLIFILNISCFTKPNLLWFVDLTFQACLQYCCLKHWICLHHQTYPRLSIVPTLAPLLHSSWDYWQFSSTLPQ